MKELKREHGIEIALKNNELEHLRVQSRSLEQKLHHYEHIFQMKDQQLEEIKKKYDSVVQKHEKQDQVFHLCVLNV